MRNNQEVFNFVASALLKQGKPSLDPKIYICMYRSADGCKCAAGWLIPDDKYNPAMEKTIITAVIDNFGLDLDANRRLVDSLQNAHDSAAVSYDSNTSQYTINTDWLNDWKEKMRGVAKHYGLDDSVLDS